MAAEERAKTDFTAILSRIDRKFEIIHTKWTGQKVFEVKFRSQIQRDSDEFNGLCDEWVELFSEATKTVWVKKISNTGPKIRFRKQYQCWTHGGKVQKELLFDNKKCKGTLDIKVLTDNPFTRRKNRHAKLGLNVVVKISFYHLHPVDTEHAFAFFVHQCESLPEAPEVIIQPNYRLPELIANEVQKGLEASAVEPPKDMYQTTLLLEELGAKPVDSTQPDNFQFQNFPQHTIVQNFIPAMDTIKVELPHFQPYAQFVVNDMAEPLVMCQPLMLDTAQLIPIQNSLSSNFIQIQPHLLN